MLFNSYIFVLAFLPLVLLAWWSPLAPRVRLAALTLASYVFYAWWDYRFVALMIASTVLDYVAGRRIAHATSPLLRRLWLLASLGGNLGLLGYFKYAGFFARTVNSIGSALTGEAALSVPDIVLPIGISFYTFQSMSYSIDIYRRQAKPTNSFLHFSAYVSMFPQLIAGPIVRYTQLEEQLREVPRSVNWAMFYQGWVFFILGMAQKVLIADNVARLVDPMLAEYAGLQLAGSWYAMIGYSCQLYFDFSGYSNMAVGLGLMLGFRFPQNFASPYKASNISDFWRRWHVTLSNWLRDYLFFPLGGSRFGALLTCRNLVIVMFLGGLWHGAAWTYVLWGLYQGVSLVVYHVWRTWGKMRMPHPMAVAVTFLSFVLGLAVFRSTDMNMASSVLSSMGGLNGIESNVMVVFGGKRGLLALMVAVVPMFAVPNIWQFRLKANWLTAVSLGVLLAACIVCFAENSPFLYYQF